MPQAGFRDRRLSMPTAAGRPDTPLGGGMHPTERCFRRLARCAAARALITATAVVKRTLKPCRQAA